MGRSRADRAGRVNGSPSPSPPHRGTVGGVRGRNDLTPVRRDRLLRRAGGAAVVFVEAPGGFGKSSFAHQLATSLDQAVAVAVVDEPGDVSAALLGALRTSGLSDLVGALDAVDPSSFADALAARPGGVAIVIDEVQRGDSCIGRLAGRARRAVCSPVARGRGRSATRSRPRRPGDGRTAGLVRHRRRSAVRSRRIDRGVACDHRSRWRPLRRVDGRRDRHPAPPDRRVAGGCRVGRCSSGGRGASAHDGRVGLLGGTDRTAAGRERRTVP